MHTFPPPHACSLSLALAFVTLPEGGVRLHHRFLHSSLSWGEATLGLSEERAPELCHAWITLQQMGLLQQGSLSHFEILSCLWPGVLCHLGMTECGVLPGLQEVLSSLSLGVGSLWVLGPTMNGAKVPRTCTAVSHWVYL